MAIMTTNTQHYSDIADAIRSKNGSNSTYTPAQMAAAISAISGSGSGSSSSANEVPSGVRFYDYDGTVLYDYTEAQFAQLSALPSNPSHTGLTAQGWNWTLEEIQTQLLGMPGQRVEVGQSYITDDGKTRIYITIPADILPAERVMTIRYGQSVSYGVEVDWGDGSAVSTIGGTHTVNSNPSGISHTYTNTGSYVITLNAVSGTIILFPRNGHSFIANWNINADYYRRNWVTKIELGANLQDTELSDIFSDLENLTSITIPNYITTAYDWFRHTFSLKHVTLPRSLINIKYGFFGYCSILESVSFARNLRLSSVNTGSGVGLFYECPNLKFITLPSNLTRIPKYCFYRNRQLILATLPDTVTEIQTYSFYYCSKLNWTTLPSNVTTIDTYAFAYCYNLSLTTLPSSITTLSNYVFYACYHLNISQIPAGVVSIGNYAFRYCYNLTNIVFPSSLTSIGEYSFGECGNLKEVIVPAKASVEGIINSLEIKAGAFYNCYNLQKANFPDYAQFANGKYIFSNCYNLKECNIPSNTTVLSEQIFSTDYSLTSITIPASVTTINKNAFTSCERLQTVTMSNNVTSIDTSCFSSCNILKSINLSTSLTTLPDSCFANCYLLPFISIPSNVTTIGRSVFSYCRSLTTLTIPANVTSMGASCINYCYALQELHLLPTTPPTLGGTILSGASSNLIIYVPYSEDHSILNSYKTATYWSTWASYMQEEPQ